MASTIDEKLQAALSPQTMSLTGSALHLDSHCDLESGQPRKNRYCECKSVWRHVDDVLMSVAPRVVRLAMAQASKAGDIVGLRPVSIDNPSLFVSPAVVVGCRANIKQWMDLHEATLSLQSYSPVTATSCSSEASDISTLG